MTSMLKVTYRESRSNIIEIYTCVRRLYENEILSVHLAFVRLAIED